MADELIEITIVLGEDKLMEMLNAVKKAKKKGDSSALVEYGAINFQLYVNDSVKLREFDSKHGDKGRPI